MGTSVEFNIKSIVLLADLCPLYSLARNLGN